MAANKKSFDFRMSKKVAELTQVVHMLFTRNHEKEIEIEALKDAYEDEISRVIRDAKGKITDLEQQLEEINSKTSANANGLKELERVREHMKSKEDEWKNKVTTLELQLKSEKLECQNVRDLLIQAQKDIERLRESQSQDEESKTNENERQRAEIERLKSQITILKQQTSDFPKSELLQELQERYDHTVKDLSALKNTLKESENSRQQLMSKNKSLEEQIKELKRQINKSNERNSSSVKQGVSSATKASIIDYTEEINRLQNEIKRYRMELSNREGNFNRMFTDKNPIILNRKASRLSSDAPHMRYTLKQDRDRPMVSSDGLAMQVNFNVGGVRPPSQSGVHHGLDISQIETEMADSLTTRYRSPSALSTSSSLSRLPHLGLDARRRLSKPKPLPRGLISAKATVH